MLAVVNLNSYNPLSASSSSDLDLEVLEDFFKRRTRLSSELELFDLDLEPEGKSPPERVKALPWWVA
jgi:hypothetical protein